LPKFKELFNLKRLYYGWVIVLLALFIVPAQGIAVYSFGIFLRPLTLEFGWERGAASGAFSAMMLIGGGLAIIAGRLADKYGPRLLLTINGLLYGLGFLLISRVSSLLQMYLIWGVIMGLAFSCGFIPIVSTIPRWFIKKRGVALGVAVAGYGLGEIISPPLAQWLISSYGWRQAAIILGIIILVLVIPLAQFMKHSPQRMGLKPYGEDEKIDESQKQSLLTVRAEPAFADAVRTGAFWFFSLILFGYSFSFGVLIVHVAPYAIDMGISALVAASIVSIVGGASIIGRFSTGFISDKMGTRRVLLIWIAILTVALIWLVFAREVWMFYLFAAVYGVAYGGIVPLYTLTTAELFGLKSLGIISATAFFMGAIGDAIGAPVAGSIFDVSGSYQLALIICVIIGVLSVVLSLILLRSKTQYGEDAAKIILKT